MASSTTADQSPPGPTESHPGDQYDVPAFEAHESATSLKGRIKKHYEIASDYYYSLWGQHIHHGYFKSPAETKEQAQVNLIDYLLDISALPAASRVLDVGCGVGGTSRFLARERACRVTGITISGRQVEIAQRLTLAEISSSSDAAAGADGAAPPQQTQVAATATTTTEGEGKGEGKGEGPAAARTEFMSYPKGKARFLELDAEKMREYFSSPAAETSEEDSSSSFDCVWISEALSHLPDKPLFFASSFALLRGAGGGGGGGRLVIADWFRAENLSAAQVEADIRPIEDGMLLPRLFTAAEYVGMAEAAGFRVRQAPIDISKDVAKTWDISWSLVSSPSLWAFAISQGRDGLSFLQAFRAMRRGYANGTFRYAIMCFEKP
ncbi:S-adenosyl-L-methionine-dependent methyltransferase [Xylariaceae sp. FL0804]|nr:S-adenosyl-L-methionine-dependent methyltransferase [Xylariaceae sp. FL0804]